MPDDYSRFNLPQLCERVAKCEEHDRGLNGSINRIELTLQRMEEKFDARFASALADDRAMEKCMDARIQEIDKHVWSLLVRVGIIWTIINGGLLVGVGWFVTQTLTGGQ